jgi:hypothetical protein
LPTTGQAVIFTRSTPLGPAFPGAAFPAQCPSNNRPQGVNGAIMSKTKQPDTFQLVFFGPGKKKEEVLFTSPKLLDVELKREQHIRSITSGYVEIRKA